MVWHDGFQTALLKANPKDLGAFVFSSLHSIREKPPARENKVAYLDGLRGFAAFLVYCTHHTAFAHDHEKRLHHAFGFRNEYIFAALPGIRLFFVGGSFAVALFFVISGYALSLSSTSLIHKQGSKAGPRLVLSIGSSFPRRWIRLYFPVVVTTFVWMTSWHLFNIQSSNPAASAPADTFAQEFKKWLGEFVEGSYVFVTSAGFGQNDYNPHMWSIAVEYRGSVVVYISILAYFALGYTPTARFIASLALFAYFQLVADGPYYALFVAGMVLCDLDYVLENDPQRLPRFFQHPIWQKHTWIHYLVLFAGVYLGSAPLILEPSNMHDEPGYNFLSYLIPSSCSNARWYFCVYSGVLCVMSIPRIPLVRRLFESSLFQYLGRISFGFYLVHGPVMWTIGDRLNAAVGRPRATAGERISGWIDLFPLSDRGPLGLEINYLIPHIILLPVTLLLAGFVTKMVDTPSVKLGKFLFPQRDQKQGPMEDHSAGEPLLPNHVV